MQGETASWTSTEDVAPLLAFARARTGSPQRLTDRPGRSGRPGRWWGWERAFELLAAAEAVEHAPAVIAQDAEKPATASEPAASEPSGDSKKDGADGGSGSGSSSGSGGAVDHPLLAPISAEAPAGEDPKLTDEFDALYTELEKLAAIESTPVDWRMIRETSETILTTISKDLRCLLYWTVARLHLEKLDGLQQALPVAVAVLERYGDDMSPKRPKGRAGALRWLGARFEVDVPTIAKSAPEEQLTALHKGLDAIQAAMENRAKSLEGVQQARSALMGVKSIKPKPKPKPRPAAKPKAATARPARAAAPASAAPAVPPELEGVVEQMLEQANELAAGAESLYSLRLRRIALWMAPPAVLQGRKMDCDGLEPKTRLALADLAKKQEWEELLQQTEELLPSAPFCIDLTHWAALAAKAVLGDKDAELALAAEAVALTLRAPKLARGTDRNGQALVSKEARAWIRRHRGSSGDGSAPAATASAPASPAPDAATATAAAPAAAPETLPEEIEAMFKNGQVNEAMRRASATAAGLSGRAGFQRNLLLAERLLSNRASRQAYPLFRALLGQLRTTPLTDWEPRAGARCIKGYLECARSNKAKIENEHELIDELMLLDPSLAVELL